VNNLDETTALAKEFAKMLVGGEVVLLGGDLGAGKTTFTKSVLRALGVKGDITSPTFTIMREYNGKKMKVYHFDMYRLTCGAEATEFGLEDYIYNKDRRSVVFIEWPENIKDILAGEFIKVNISIVEDDKRKFEISRGTYEDIRN
jgi:tRNA threonylcarbamoyladenosine biosynthesis protein TsaE